jgi:hypothetical protein
MSHFRLALRVPYAAFRGWAALAPWAALYFRFSRNPHRSRVPTVIAKLANGMAKPHYWSLLSNNVKSGGYSHFEHQTALLPDLTDANMRTRIDRGAHRRTEARAGIPVQGIPIDILGPAWGRTHSGHPPQVRSEESSAGFTETASRHFPPMMVLADTMLS